ncbi:MAG: DUF3341 domain-containing protein [Planctomycetes bacterium]|nr:DUF3341 domain-containing protein [Planctomycetota bacterium]
MKRRHLASFDDEHALLGAIARCRAAQLDVVEAWSPHPVHGLDAQLGIPRSRLPMLAFAGGATGLVLGTVFQYWSSAVDWPIDVGGKPFDSLPAFMPVMFELTVLCAGLTTVFALLARSRLWPGKVVRAHPGVTDDRFVLAAVPRDPTLPAHEVDRMLLAAGAERAWEETIP